MQLTEKTISVLRNFADINANIKFNGNDTVKTMSEARNIVAKATIETFPDRECCIYDLNEFLGTLSLVDQAEVTFGEHNMLIKDQSGRSRIKYYYAQEASITTPTKDIVMPSSEVQFTLDRSTLTKLKKAAGTLKHEELIIEPADGALRLSMQDPENKTSNSYSIDVAGKFESNDFKLVFQIANFKMIEGDYEVALSKKTIAHFKHTSEPIEYWIAMEKSSEYR